jgi:23S rRNA (uridine2552-2'-O)-methyltransferase
MARSKTSKQWMNRHVNDEYVKRSVKDGYRSRAVYKLLELDDSKHFLKPGQLVIDLGAAPGGWSQVASQRVGEKGQVIGIDLLPIDPLPDVIFLEGDFREEKALKELTGAMQGRQADLVLSDMAPNMSGMSAVDQPRAIYLCELALDFCLNHLKPGGGFVAKVFQGEGFQEFLAQTREHFDKVGMKKPKASRPNSREMYLVADGFKG